MNGDIIFQLVSLLIPIIAIALIVVVLIYLSKRKKQLDRIEGKLNSSPTPNEFNKK